MNERPRFALLSLSAFLLVSGSEGIFASGGSWVFRPLVIAGVVLLGWSQLSWRDLRSRTVVSLIVALYVAAASARYSGLAKEPWPLHWSDQARLFAVFFCVVLLGSFAVSAIRAIVGRVLSR